MDVLDDYELGQVIDRRRGDLSTAVDVDINDL